MVDAVDLVALVLVLLANLHPLCKAEEGLVATARGLPRRDTSLVGEKCVCMRILLSCLKKKMACFTQGGEPGRRGGVGGAVSVQG